MQADLRLRGGQTNRGGRHSPAGLCDRAGVEGAAAKVDPAGSKTNTTTAVGSYEGGFLQLKPALQAEHGPFFPGNPDPGPLHGLS